MKTIVKLSLISCLFFLVAFEPNKTINDKKEFPSAIFGGGPIYLTPGASIPELGESGFGTLINWTIHINSDGGLNFNQEFPLISNGEYIGNQTHPDFLINLQKFNQLNSTVSRLEFGLSGAGSLTYTNIKMLINCDDEYCGTHRNSILYRNFKILKKSFPTLVAINNDDETEYDLESSLQFHKMLADIGFKTTIVPYARKSFWRDLITGLNEYKAGTVDRLYLQDYAGGDGNEPCEWDFGVPVYPGLSSSKKDPSEVKQQIMNWKLECPEIVKGGFMWLYDDFQDSDLVSEYASEINKVFND